jgi:hypothetical protein
MWHMLKLFDPFNFLPIRSVAARWEQSLFNCHTNQFIAPLNFAFHQTLDILSYFIGQAAMIRFAVCLSFFDGSLPVA